VATTLKQRAYEHIRRKLMLGELGPGDRLSNRVLAREIGASIIPVREAISQLASEGLAVHKPGLGSFVPATSREELKEVYDVREALECHAIDKAVGALAPADAEKMQAHIDALAAIVDETASAGDADWDTGQVERWLEAESAFHLALLRAAGNLRAIELVTTLRLFTHLFFAHHDLTHVRRDSRRVCVEHQRVLDAILEGDAAAARACMAAHLRTGCRGAIHAYERRRLEGTVPQLPILPQHKA